MKFACFIMLNPSTADGEVDDPTIRRCMGFARQWGYDQPFARGADISADGVYRYTLTRPGLIVVNLFAYRTAEPRNLVRAARDGTNIVGSENDGWILSSARRADIVVCGWGAQAIARERAYDVLSLLQHAGVPTHCLKTTKSGAPQHPLYLRLASKPLCLRKG